MRVHRRVVVPPRWSSGGVRLGRSAAHSGNPTECLGSQALSIARHADRTVTGRKDALIPPVDVLVHYDAFKVHGKDVCIKTVDGVCRV